jgi:hypothetical protein
MPKSKFNTKKVHFNPKKKKPNKNHRQHYWKKENKKIDKSKFIEIKGKRSELKGYLGHNVIVEGFLTNTYGYGGLKRLVNSIVLPIKKDDKNLYINHVWIKSSKVSNIQHGYKRFKAKIIEYLDKYTNETKYGLKFIEIV